MRLDRFYPIFDSVAWLERMLPLGVKLVQLRIKDTPEVELLPIISRAQALCRQHGAVLVVNDHWRVAIEAGCDWLHLGQEDLDEADLPAIRRAGLRLGDVEPGVARGRGERQRQGEEQRLVLQTSGLAHDHHVDRASALARSCADHVTARAPLVLPAL